MIIPSHVQRVQGEAAELRAKLTALREFTMLNPMFKTLPEEMRNLMLAQRKAMGAYLGCLEARLELMLHD